MLNIIGKVTIPEPAVLSPAVYGAETLNQAYNLHVPSIATEPLVVTAPTGEVITWKPGELAYRDASGQLDYIIGSSASALLTMGKQAKYNRVFPNVDDTFHAQADQVKHWTILHEPPRQPASYLGAGIEFGVSGIITGCRFPVGFCDSAVSHPFILPTPVIKDLTNQEITGRYEILDGDGYQQIFIWFPASFLANAVYPVMIDPTIGTSTTSPLPSSPWRRMDRSTDGTIWVLATDGTAGKFYYSKDGGQTWTYSGSGSDIANFYNGSLFIDIDDYAHVIFRNSASTYYIYARGTPNAGKTAWTWATTTISGISSDYSSPMGVAHREGTGWVFHYVSDSLTTPSNDLSVVYRNLTISSSGDVTINSPVGLEDNAEAFSHAYAQLDFNHIGDGKTVAGSTPHIYACWQIDASGADKIAFRKATYSGGVWTWGAIRTMDATYAINGSLACCFDGTRFLIAYHSYATGWATVVHRDAADTNTATYDATMSYLNTSGGVCITYDADGNIYLFGIATQPKWIKYTRGVNSWGSWVNVEAVTAKTFTLTSKRGYYDGLSGSIEVIWAEGSANPYTIKYNQTVTFNVAPNPPINLTRASYDATQAANYIWTFADPNPGNTQSAYQLIIEKVSDGSTVLDTGKVVSTASSHSVLANTLTNGNQYRWKVKTWDNLDTVGDYSSYATFYANTAPTTAITFPAADATVISANAITPQWSYSDAEAQAQASYQLLLTASDDVVLWDSGKVSDVNARQRTINYALINLTSYKIKLTVWDSFDTASTQAVRTFSTSFTPPAVPTIVSAGDATNGRITITITNPTPQGLEPGNLYNDLHRRKQGETAWVRLATQIAVNGSYSDYTPQSATIYEYKVTIYGDNDTSNESLSQTGTVTFKGVWLHDVTSSAATVHQFEYDGKGRDFNWVTEGILMGFAGRIKPVAEFGDREDGVVNIKLQMMKGDTDHTVLESLIKSRATLCYRDDRGRKSFGVVFEMPISDERYGYTTQIKLNETSYSEEV